MIGPAGDYTTLKSLSGPGLLLLDISLPDFIGHIAAGGCPIASRPQVLPPIALAQPRKFDQQLIRRGNELVQGSYGEVAGLAQADHLLLGGLQFLHCLRDVSSYLMRYCHRSMLVSVH